MAVIKNVCMFPFYGLEIAKSGKVYTCCPAYNNFYTIGDITDPNVSSMDDILNSDALMELKKRILNHDYSLCNNELCKQKCLTDIDEYEAFKTYPKFITLAYDTECNISCITCRDCLTRNDDEKTAFYNEKIIPLLMPVLLNIEHIRINGAGEALYSRHTRQLIKTITSNNPKARFTLYTNGLLFNDYNITALGLNGRIEEVDFSVHSLEKETYEKIMRGSNLDVVLGNIKNAHKYTDNIIINTVISNLNYSEIPNFIKFGQEHHVRNTFSVYTKWGAAIDKDYEDYAVWNPEHRNYPNLKQIMREVLAQNLPGLAFSPILSNIARENN